MSTPTAPPASTEWTAAEVVDRFGPIPLWRIRQVPAPGTAVEEDVLAIRDREKRLFELVDGVLVEKTVGMQESYLAAALAGLIASFADAHDLGIVLGSDGMARLARGLVRIPDVSFVSWSRLGGRQVPPLAMLQGGPDLAVEVISPGNTRKEMEAKLREYFASDVLAVWFVDPRKRTVRVYSSPDRCTSLDDAQILIGGDVLPGFEIALSELFARLERLPEE